jgi:hypothetical protein
MTNYFLSFTSTFESLLKGKVTPADLVVGSLVFGCKRDHVLMPYDRIPIEITLNNKIKSKHTEQASSVTRQQVDTDVLKAWDTFAAQIRKASTEGRLVFLWDIGHPSYRRFSREALRRGDRVFWRGIWVSLDDVAPDAAAGSVVGVSVIDSTARHPHR